MQRDPLLLAERQPRYERRETERAREVPCPFTAAHHGKTCGWLFRKAGKSYHSFTSRQVKTRYG